MSFRPIAKFFQSFFKKKKKESLLVNIYSEGKGKGNWKVFKTKTTNTSVDIDLTQDPVLLVDDDRNLGTLFFKKKIILSLKLDRVVLNK